MSAVPIPIRGPRVVHDGLIKIAVGTSRKSTSWKTQELLWSQLLERLSACQRTQETLDEYKAMPKSQKDDIKDIGGFVGGELRGKRRLSSAVASRYLVTLDADNVSCDLWELLTLCYDYAACVYSTHSHEPAKPRLRLVIPLARPVSPEEYQAVARRIAADLGIDQFDPSTFEPHRLMYWPSCPRDVEPVYAYQDGPWLDPDSVLKRYQDWRDPAQWPAPVKEHETRKKNAEKAEDPTTKKGVVGAFCRTYDIHQAIETFLSDVYAPAGENRYTYVPGSTTGGLVVYDGGLFAYSHHGTDPCSGKLVNAFDLVRLHKFGHLDDGADPDTPTVRLPSYEAMVELAESDSKVKETVKQEREKALAADFAGEPVDAKTLFFDGKKFVPAYMGEWFLKRHHAFVLNDHLYVYKKGVYVRGERIFHEETTAALGVEFATRRVNEALAYTKNSVPELSPTQVVDTGDYLNVKNGLLNLKTLELEPHTPEYKSTIQLPVSYNPDATCPAIDEFLTQVLPPDCINVVEEMIGYCLVPTMKYEKAFLLYGDGGNGKGTLIQLIAQLVGPQNMSNVSLQDLGENRFAAATLFGKLVNLHADIPNKVIDDTSQFKELVSGDWIQAEEKYKGAFTFQNRAKLIFSVNELPASKDNTAGFHRRLIIIPFPNKFNDRALRQRLFEPGELEGLLLRALQGLRRLEEQGGFSLPPSVREQLDTYREKSDTAFRFLRECCVLDEGAMIGKQELYDAYRSACVSWGGRPVSQMRFNAHLQMIYPTVTEYKKEPPRRWKGIKYLPIDFLN